MPIKLSETQKYMKEITTAAAAKSLQSCLTLCDPIDSSPPGSSVPGILQARILEWAAISFSNACMHTKSLPLCLTLRPYGQQPTRLLHPQDSLGKNTGVGCHFLLQVRLGAVEPGWDGLEPLNHFCPHHLGPQKVSSYLWAAVSPTEPGINISLLPPQASWEPQLRQWMFNCSGIPQKLGKQLCGKGTVPYLLNWRELFCRHSVPPDCESVHHWAKPHDVFSKSYTTLCKLSLLRCKL